MDKAIQAAKAAYWEWRYAPALTRARCLFAIHDIGRAINPTVVEGQIEGALQQGIGYALTEDPVIDEKTGKMENANFANYMVLTALDMPKIQIGLSEPIDPTGPFGAKGIGEPSTLGVAPTIANAIYNAIGSDLQRFRSRRKWFLKL